MRKQETNKCGKASTRLLRPDPSLPPRQPVPRSNASYGIAWRLQREDQDSKGSSRAFKRLQTGHHNIKCCQKLKEMFCKSGNLFASSEKERKARVSPQCRRCEVQYIVLMKKINQLKFMTLAVSSVLGLSFLT